MLRRVTVMAAAAALGMAMLLVPTQPAYAADGCGSGWSKESDGYLQKDDVWVGGGNRAAFIHHAGRVRFCTDNDKYVDDPNRRAVIGYPIAYAFESDVNKRGHYRKFCMWQTIDVHMTGIQSSSSWSIGGTISKDSPGVTFSYSRTQNTVTVTYARNRNCAANADSLTTRTSNVVATADNDSGEVQWVKLTTRIRAVYWVNGTKHVDNFSVGERDYS
jgi:hypothetical protein